MENFSVVWTDALTLDAAMEKIRSEREVMAEAKFVLVFSTDHYPATVLAQELQPLLGDTPWVGCCTGGVFVDRHWLPRGIALGIFSDPRLEVGIGRAGSVSQDPQRSGRHALRRAQKALSEGVHSTQEADTAWLLLTDALTGNPAEVLRGAVDEMGSGALWVGGGAGDNLQFLQTALFCEGKAFQDQTVAVGLRLRQAEWTGGLAHGWSPCSEAVLASETRGKTVVSLNYQNAYNAYRSLAQAAGYWNPEQPFNAFAAFHPLGIPAGQDNYLIRDPLSVDEQGHIHCVADVPTGALVHVMRGTRDSLLEAARDSVNQANTKAGLSGVVAFHCVSRRLIWEADFDQEIQTLKDTLGTAPLLGCLSFGEVGAQARGIPRLHNKSIVTLGVP